MGLDIDAKYDVGFGFDTLFVAAHVDGLNGSRGHGQKAKSEHCHFEKQSMA
jgi:hypothetical protein